MDGSRVANDSSASIFQQRKETGSTNAYMPFSRAMLQGLGLVVKQIHAFVSEAYSIHEVEIDPGLSWRRFCSGTRAHSWSDASAAILLWFLPLDTMDLGHSARPRSDQVSSHPEPLCL